jgi:membrane-associated phospholipid phosphatase
MALSRRFAKRFGVICVTATFLVNTIAPVWGGPLEGDRVPESGSPLRLVALEDGNSTPGTVSDILAYGSAGLAVVYGLGLSFAAHSAETDDYIASPFADIFLAGALNYLVTFTLKSSLSRARPYTFSANYPEGGGFEYSEAAQDDAMHSFPSGHISNTAAFLFSIATTSTYHLPEYRFRTATLVLLYGLATTGTLVVGEMRVRAGQHFYSDVIVGGFIGTTLGVVVPILNHYLARRFGEKEQVTMGLSPTPTPGGLSISLSGHF